jgi:hypothetical protein
MSHSVRLLVLVPVSLLVPVVAISQGAAGSHVFCPAFLTARDSSEAKMPIALALLNRGYNVGANESAAVTLLGRPAERQVDTVTNRYGPLTDSIINLRYSGLEVSFYKSVDTGRELLGAITLTSPACRVYPGLRVGAPAAVLRRLFGRPTFEADRGDTTVVQYEASTEGPVYSYLNFRIRLDTIRAIQWQFGID